MKRIVVCADGTWNPRDQVDEKTNKRRDKAFSKVTEAHAYHDVSLNDNVQNAYQALAIDEHRKAFAPSIWSAPHGWTRTLRPAWFVGSTPC